MASGPNWVFRAPAGVTSMFKRQFKKGKEIPKEGPLLGFVRAGVRAIPGPNAMPN
jgi:hypothetical protein